MEKIGETMAKLGQNTRVNSDQLIQTILADPEVASFISQHHLSQEQINLSLSKFNQFLVERQKYQLKDPSYIAKGYQPILAMNEGYADVSYLETKELVEAQNRQLSLNGFNWLVCQNPIAIFIYQILMLIMRAVWKPSLLF